MRNSFWFGNMGSRHNNTVDAYLSKAAASGYTLPSASQILIYDDAFNYLDDEGETPLYDVMGLFKTPNQNLCSIPLIHVGGAATRLDLIGNFTFTANTGIKSSAAGAGAGGYIDTNYNAATMGVNFTQNNASYGANVLSDLDTANYVMGTPTGECRLAPKSGGFTVYSINSITSSLRAAATSAMLTSISRVNGTQQRLNQNGSLIETKSANSSAVVNEKFYVLTNSSANGTYTENVNFFFIAGNINQAKNKIFMDMLLL